MKIAALFRGTIACTLMTAACVSLTASARAQTAYALSNNNGITTNTLIRFDVSTPGIVTTIGTFSGDATYLTGLDFRASNGLLYGYDYYTDSLVTVDLNTAVTTFVSAARETATINIMGIDFNPTVDRLRLVNDDEQNLRITPETGVTDVDGTLAYPAGDPGFNANPGIIDAAYTNNDTNPATGTTLYYLDYRRDTLVSTTNPNSGVLNTVGALGVNTNSSASFDIYTSAPNVNTAYAVLTTGAELGGLGTPGLYTINLGTGAATLVGNVNSSRITGLAIQPVAAAAPEPGSFALLLTAGVPVVCSVRRRAKNRT